MVYSLANLGSDLLEFDLDPVIVAAKLSTPEFLAGVLRTVWKSRSRAYV